MFAVMDVVGSKSLRGPCLGFRRFFFAVLRRRGSFERAQQAARGSDYFLNRGGERGFVGLRRFVETADLPDELERCGAHFLLGNRRIEIEKIFDVSTHKTSLTREMVARLAAGNLSATFV
jgi:hypothetical protein